MTADELSNIERELKRLTESLEKKEPAVVDAVREIIVDMIAALRDDSPGVEKIMWHATALEVLKLERAALRKCKAESKRRYEAYLAETGRKS